MILAAALVVCASEAASPAQAQTLASAPDADGEAASAPAAAKPGLLEPFTHIFGDMKRLPAADHNVDWLIVGLGAAMATRHADVHVSHTLSTSVIRDPFRPGAIVGATPLGLGAAFATYAIGRASDKPRAMALGSDLIRAQLLAEALSFGVKQAVRRTRPDGARFSFPSGHTTVSFASATVLQQHFGWKVGAPAYAVAAYVAASRVQMRRHYLSDVAFGAALGIVAGRTVTIGREKRLVLTPIATTGGAGIGFTLVGKPPSR